MNKSSATALTLVAAALAIATPVYLAINLSRSLSLDAESNRSMVYARDVLRRTEATAAQVGTGIERLLAADRTDPCSDANIDLMRQIDLGSTYIQAMGYMEGNFVRCSSLGRHLGDGINLRDPDFITGNDVAVRLDVTFRFSDGQTFIALARDGYVGIIHKDLPIDTSTQEADTLLAAFSRENGILYAARGDIPPEWREELNGRVGDSTFLYRDYIVSIANSPTTLVGSLAAIPQRYATQRTRNFALLLIPVGLVAGAVLAFSVIHLARMQLALPTVIRTALKRHEFFMAYQPVVDLRSGRTVGAEALVRWRRANGELVRPDLFIQVAEDEGIINLITARVVELVMGDIQDLFRRHPDFHIGINLSSEDLHSQATVGMLLALAQSSCAKPGSLLIEATERSMLNLDLATRVLGSLHEAGLKVAIDDFGTGYSSLSTLQALPIDILKIDRAFVSTIGTDAPTRGVLPNIIQIAKDLGLEMVAEGVETEAQANYLRTQGVQYAQGWLFGKPESFAHLQDRINRELRTTEATAALVT